MSAAIDFSPLLPWGFILGLAVLSLAAALLALWKGAAGWALRALASVALGSPRSPIPA